MTNFYHTLKSEIEIITDLSILNLSCHSVNYSFIMKLGRTRGRLERGARL